MVVRYLNLSTQESLVSKIKLHSMGAVAFRGLGREEPRGRNPAWAKRPGPLPKQKPLVYPPRKGIENPA